MPPPAPGPATGTRAERAAPTRTRDRVGAIDAVRGLAIVIMLLAVHPGPRGGMPSQLEHPAWHGVTFADLFFPLFLFAIGASMPFSARAATAGSVARRAGLLFVIGMALVSAKNLAFHVPGVLQHIAVAYVLAWLVLELPRRAQLLVCVAAVLGFWAAYLAVASPGADPWSSDGDTLAHVVNGWFFDGFRTEGLPQSVLSTVNVVAGAFATQWILDHEDRRAVVRIAIGWAAGLVLAALVMAQWVPLNKKLWTPSFTVLTVGTSIAWFAAALWVIDVRRKRRWAQPLVELGSNAIAVYVVSMAAFAVVIRHRRGFDDAVADTVPWPTVVSLGWAAAWTLLGWWFCRTLYRRRIFIKV